MPDPNCTCVNCELERYYNSVGASPPPEGTPHTDVPDFTDDDDPEISDYLRGHPSPSTLTDGR